MLPPISEPTGKYRLTEPFLSTEENPILRHPDLPAVENPVIVEPELTVDNVDWQPGSRKFQPPIAVAPFLNKPSVPVLNERIGGKITFFLYVTGSNIDTQKLCIESLKRTLPREYVDLRVIANEIGVDTLNLIRELNPDYVYRHGKRKPRYTAMREAFWDSHNPIKTNYVIWMEDIARVAHLNWFNTLIDDIIKQPDNVGIFGMRKVYPFRLQNNKNPCNWFKSASWYKGVHFLTERGSPAPNGSTVHFCDHWFWAMKTQAIRECNIPCPRIEDRGGDIVIGEQLHQSGYKIKDFNVGKALIYAPASSLKNASGVGKFPWD